MRKRDRKVLAGYVRCVADAMQLRDWTITIEHEPADEGDLATCHCVNGQRWAILRFSKDFRSEPPEEQRDTVVHELVHIHLDVCWRMVQSDLGDALGKPVYYVFADSYRRAMEYSVDALTKTIAPQVPLIDWPS